MDDIEKALMTLSIKERLYLQDSDVDAVSWGNLSVSMLLRSMQLHVKCCCIYYFYTSKLTPPTSPSLIQLDRDVVGKVSLTTGKPIVPKLVRGQSAADILIKPSAPGAAASSSNTAKTPGLQSEAKQGKARMT